MRSIPSRHGFTLIEVLMALVLATVILGPTSLWLYRRSQHSEAFNRLTALSVLETEMQKAMLGPLPKESWSRILPDGSTLQIILNLPPGEVRLLGQVMASGQVRATLVASRYRTLDSLAGGNPP